jgi:uncharacterized protein YbbC (DUF1343 family)
MEAYRQYPKKEAFFISRFAYLAGTKKLEEQIKNGWSEMEIRNSWEPQLSQFKTMRKKYLLYPN